MTGDIELRHLRYFAALAEELHFGRAAARLGIAQPHLSYVVRRMESVVGTRLLERRPRVELTAAGQLLLDSARMMLAQAERGLDAARRAAQGEAGALTIGFASSVMFTDLPAIFREYRRRYPAVDLRLREMHSAPQLDALRAGTVDVGFLREPPAREELIGEVVVREPLVVMLPSGHGMARRSRLELGSLARESFVLFPRAVAPSLHDQILSACAEASFTPRIVQEANEWHTLAGLVEAGFGVCLAPAGVSKLGWQGTVCRAITPARPRTSILLCWRKDDRSPTVRAFVKLARGRGWPRATDTTTTGTTGERA